MKKEIKTLVALVLLFAACFFLPVGSGRFDNAVLEGLALLRWYTREYLLLTLLPAFLVAGAIGAFLDRDSVLRCLGARANKWIAYSVAAVSGAVVAVCSCAVLPLFSGIHKKGAGLGPAVTFLYSGPAINILAIVLTARVLGIKLGIARAVAAIIFSVVIGLIMQFVFRREPAAQVEAETTVKEGHAPRNGFKTLAVFITMIAVMVFMNWARSGDVRAVLLCCPGGLTTYEVEGQIVEQTETHVTILDTDGRELIVTRDEVMDLQDVGPRRAQNALYVWRWTLVAVLGILLVLMLWRWFDSSELKEWSGRSWGFAKRMLPALVVGVLAAGFLMGGSEGEGVIPRYTVEMLVGVSPDPFLSGMGIADGMPAACIRAAWTLWTNCFASILGVVMYFATLTEVPIISRLMRSGMGQGPALALLLAGPAVSLPNMIVIRNILGTKKTLVYVGLVVTMATVSGMIYGAIV